MNREHGRGVPAGERKVVLLRWAGLLQRHFAVSALLEALDTGKPIMTALSVDIEGAVGCAEFCGDSDA